MRTPGAVSSRLVPGWEPCWETNLMYAEGLGFNIGPWRERGPTKVNNDELCSLLKIAFELLPWWDLHNILPLEDWHLIP